MAVWSLTSLQGIRSTRRADSEFFRPEYLFAEQRVRACDFVELGRLGGFVPGPFGSAFHVQNYDFKSPYRYIRGKDVKPFFLLNDDNRYLPASDFHRLSQYEVCNDDLMISVVGTLGNVAICTDEDVPAMFSCKSTLFRSKEADPYFLLAYLNSAPGLLCMLRRQRGAIQAGLNMEDLRTIPVPRFGEEVELEIASDVRAAHRKQLTSRDAFNAAQQLLNAELGLDKLEFQRPVGYTAQFSEVMGERRANAEYFSPVVKKILASKLFDGAQSLDSHFSILRGKTPAAFSASGVAVLKTKAIRTPSVDLDRVDDYTKSTVDLTAVEEGDLILASMGVGSLGRISYAYGLFGKFVVDGTLRVLRRKLDSPLDIAVPYMLFLSSRAGQELIYRGIVGSTGIISLPDAYLRRILLPNIDRSIRRELTRLVEDSMAAKEQAKTLLSRAKTRVEQLIEAAVQP